MSVPGYRLRLSNIILVFFDLRLTIWFVHCEYWMNRLVADWLMNENGVHKFIGLVQNYSYFRFWHVFQTLACGGRGGGGGVGWQGRELPHWTCWARQIKSVDGYWVSLDSVILIVVCCALQLFAIFMAEKLVGPRCVQIVSKRLVSQTPGSIEKWCLVY